MKVRNMESSSGNTIANQFIISDTENDFQVEYFQSYDSIIAKKLYKGISEITLDRHYWNYSVTTSKYRNLFLGETKKETQAKIDSGEYQLVDLN